MGEFQLSYREVIPDQTLPDVWREVTLNTGGTQSTLQDIKVAERANGYAYKNIYKHHTRNRFIYWRINHDVLEIVEQSLDVNLSGNKIRYRFIDTPILDGITIYERFNNVVILVPTVCSVHRLTFPHPNVLHRQDEVIGSHPDLTVPSIFAEASAAHARDPTTFNVFSNPNTANAQLPHAAASLLSVDEEAIFLLAYPSGEILLVRQASSGRSVSIELKHESFMPRFISGIAEKFRSRMSDGNVVVSMLLHSFGLEIYGLTLCRDGNLRVWSCSKGQCVAVTDILSETSDGGRQLVQGAQNHVLRKSTENSNGDIILAVFLSFASECQFHIFKPHVSMGQFRITRIRTLYSPGNDLVDFSLSHGRIWSLWRGEDGEASMHSATLSCNGSEGSHWVPVILEPLPDLNFTPDTSRSDPRQAYLQHIFYPSRFPLSVISKALGIYKRSSILSEVNVSPAVLKQRISLAVENEIQNELKEAEVNDEDYLECANWCWARFYSCCVQYHVAGLRPLGLLLMHSVSGVVLLKKSMYSFLRPLDALEHMLLCSDYASVRQFTTQPLLSEDLEVADDVIKLMDVVVYLEQQLSDSFKDTFEKELAQLRSPDTVMSELIMEILTEMDEQFTWSIAQKMNSCKDIYQAMHKLLELLKVECPLAVDVEDEFADKPQMSLNHLFSSVLGISFVTQCLQQQALMRFTVCRNLLVIQNILLERGEHEWNALEAVRSVCSPEIVVLTQASYATFYLTELIALPVLPLEQMMQRLAPLKLNPVFNLKTNAMQTVSLLELFVTSVAGSEAHKMFSKLKYTDESLSNWHTSLLPYISLLTQLIWPLSGNSIFAEWLLSSGQHIWLQQYVRLLSNWCEWNNCTRNFLLAASLLSTGEHQKAQHLFLKAAKGVYSDQFLADRVLVTPEAQLENSGYVHYYLKVIELFELHGARDCAVNIAKTALCIADKDDPHIATLHSIRFMHYLKLGHYDEAFNALMTNPDLERKKDNLRDLVKTLLDDRQLDKLMSFPYSSLEELFISIIFTRARATDTVNNIYYDFLYSYHIKRGAGFIRLAASVMYEQSFRLLQHNSVEALEKQVKCLLASLNALSLCEKKFAWVVKPSDPEEKEVEVHLPRLAGKSDEECEVITYKKYVEVLEPASIKKELELASARLRLARFDPQAVANHLTTPAELVGLLASVGIFKHALSLCAAFDLSYSFAFDNLTKQCLYLSETEDPNAWNWLIENDLHDLPAVGNCPSAVAWSLLQYFVEQFEQEEMTEIHKVVCKKIITSSAFLPQWLLTSYKKRNAPELLRLYYFSGRLEDAVALAGELLLAAMGHGKENFGFTHALVPEAPPFCLPINTLNILLHELELQNKASPEKPFEKEYGYLNNLFEKYVEMANRISEEVCKLKAPDVFS